MDVDISMATLVAGIVITNIAAILGAYISLKVSVAELKIKVVELEKDINNLGDLMRSNQ